MQNTDSGHLITVTCKHCEEVAFQIVYPTHVLYETDDGKPYSYKQTIYRDCECCEKPLRIYMAVQFDEDDYPTTEWDVFKALTCADIAYLQDKPRLSLIQPSNRITEKAEIALLASEASDIYWKEGKNLERASHSALMVKVIEYLLERLGAK